MRKVPREIRWCSCGCGDTFECRPKDEQQYLPHHWARTYLHRHSAEVKKKLSDGKMGEKNPMFGKKVWNSGRSDLPPSWNKGKKLTEEHKKKLSDSHKGYVMPESQKKKISRPLDKHWNWNGGKSFEPYPITFNSQLKDRIRVRDNFKCQLCGVPEVETERILSVHHIDYDKKNCSSENLVCLCVRCHTKTNANREQWKRFFERRETFSK